MKKRGIVFVLISLILILSVFSFVSAGMFSSLLRKTQVTGETIESACSDSDYGKDYFTKGTIIGGGVSFVQYDYCLVLTSTGQTDVTSCDASNPDCRLHEFYCENGIRKGVRVSCDYGCSNGACLPEPTQECASNADCPYIPGYETKCVDGICLLVENSCTNSFMIQEGTIMEIFGKTVKIEFIDSTRVKMNINGELTSSLYNGNSEELNDGSIITINRIFYNTQVSGASSVNFTFTTSGNCTTEEFCTDSDGGKNYYIKGTLTDSNELQTNNVVLTHDDFCWSNSSGSYVNEFYCSNQYQDSELYLCSNGCKDGACVSSAPTTETVYPAPFLVNGVLDAAIIYGTEVGTSTIEIVQAQNLQQDLQERLGSPTGDLLVKDSEASLVLDKNLIVVGTPCSNSFIYSSLGLSDCNLVEYKLGLAPGKGALKPIVRKNGKLTYLVVGYTPKELANLVTYLTTKEVVTSHSYLLTVAQANETIYIGYNCTDSDKGIKYDIKGEVTWDIDGGRKIFLDHCENQARLNESYCSGDTAKTITYDCGMQGKVCQDGACVALETPLDNTIISLLNKATYRGGLGVGSDKSCDEYCQSFGETCILGQFRVTDNSAYNSEVVRCEFKEAGRQTNCVCANPSTEEEKRIIDILNKATYRNGLGVGSDKSCDEYCQSFGETCILGQFRVTDNSAYNSEVVRCEFKEAGRQTNCVCANPSTEEEKRIIDILNKAAYRGGLGVGSDKSCDEYCQSFGETCILGQFRVTDNSAYNSEVVRCEFKEAGRQTNCVCANTPSSCTDSDKGINYYVKGYLVDYAHNANYYDVCTNLETTDLSKGYTPTSEGKILVEYYCGEKNYQYSAYECPGGCFDGACIGSPEGETGDAGSNTGPTSTNQTQNQTQHSGDTGANCEFGCMMDGKCYPFGYRKSRQFCHETNEFVPQTINEAYCENSFECRSNLCIDDECVNQGVFKKMMNWFRNSFGRNK